MEAASEFDIALTVAEIREIAIAIYLERCPEYGGDPVVAMAAQTSSGRPRLPLQESRASTMNYNCSS